MNLRRSTTSNMTETVLQYNSLPKDAGSNWRPSWPLVISNESISMLGMCGPNPVFNSGGCYGTTNAQAVPRLMQAGKCLSTPNFMTSAGPVLQASGGVACSGPTTQREYLAFPKSLGTDVRSSDSFIHGSSTGMQLPFLNLQAADRGLPSLRNGSGSALPGMEHMDPSFMHGHTSLSCLPSSASGGDYGFHGPGQEDLASSSVMNLQTISGDFGQLLSWAHTSEDSAVEDGWAFTDIDGGAIHGEAAGLVTSSRESALRVARNDHSGPDSMRPGRYSSGASEATQSNLSATNCKRQRVSWEVPCDPSTLDQQPTFLDDDMEAITAAGRTYGSSTMAQRMNQCQLQLPAESSTGNKTSTRESRLRINRGHNIRNIEPVRANASCQASGNSPRSVLAVESNLQGDVQDIAQLPPTAEMMQQQHVNMWGVQSVRTRQNVYQPCANSQLSQTSDGAFVALPQAMDACAAAIDIVSSSTSDSASIMTQQRQLNACADVDAKTACSSGMRKLDLDATGSSFLDSVPGGTVGGGDKCQQHQKLPNLSSLGISTCDASPVKGEIVSQPANTPRTSGSQVFCGEQSSLSWSANNFGLGGVTCQSMPTLDSLSSSIHGWVASGSHTNNRLQEAGQKVVAPGTWESRFSDAAFMTPVGQVTPTVNVHENEQNLRKRLSEDSIDPACKRLKEGSSKGVVTTAKTGTGATSHKSQLGPALNTNLKPRARQGSANDPQSIAARHRRERISERLKKLQDLVPNGSKVDLVTMLEKAINYVKSLQLQVKFLTADEYWSDGERGLSPDAQGVSLELAARMMTEGLAAVETESNSILRGDRQELSSGDGSFARLGVCP